MTEPKGIRRTHTGNDDQWHKTKLCRLFFENTCNKGKHCTYAHSESELRPLPRLQNTSLCKEWLEKGQCPLEGQCPYAHDKNDLRCTKGVFKTRPCWKFMRLGRCLDGESCRHAHGLRELRLPILDENGKVVEFVYDANLAKRIFTPSKNDAAQWETALRNLIREMEVVKIKLALYQILEQFVRGVRVSGDGCISPFLTLEVVENLILINDQLLHQFFMKSFVETALEIFANGRAARRANETPADDHITMPSKKLISKTILRQVQIAPFSVRSQLVAILLANGRRNYLPILSHLPFYIKNFLHQTLLAAKKFQLPQESAVHNLRTGPEHMADTANTLRIHANSRKSKLAANSPSVSVGYPVPPSMTHNNLCSFFSPSHPTFSPFPLSAPCHSSHLSPPPHLYSSPPHPSPHLPAPHLSSSPLHSPPLSSSPLSSSPLPSPPPFVSNPRLLTSHSSACLVGAPTKNLMRVTANRVASANSAIGRANDHSGTYPTLDTTIGGAVSEREVRISAPLSASTVSSGEHWERTATEHYGGVRVKEERRDRREGREREEAAGLCDSCVRTCVSSSNVIFLNANTANACIGSNQWCVAAKIRSSHGNGSIFFVRSDPDINYSRIATHVKLGKVSTAFSDFQEFDEGKSIKNYPETVEYRANGGAIIATTFSNIHTGSQDIFALSLENLMQMIFHENYFDAASSATESAYQNFNQDEKMREIVSICSRHVSPLLCARLPPTHFIFSTFFSPLLFFRYANAVSFATLGISPGVPVKNSSINKFCHANCIGTVVQ